MKNPEFEIVKKEINSEGFEGDTEGGASVFVGSKEEVQKMEERAETEGKAVDVATYIKLHKEIALPKERMTRQVHDIIDKHEKGWGWLKIVDKNRWDFAYVDKEGNLARVLIRPGDVKLPENQRLVDLLVSYGFQMGDARSYDIDTIIRGNVYNYCVDIQQELKKEKKKEFDF